MASPPDRRPRPLSPHLFAWKPAVGMIVSIVHRITGSGMALVGTVLLAWWLVAIASGPATYAGFHHVFAELWGGVLGYLFGIALTWALFQHMASGVRHFVLDTGAGYELVANRRWARSTFVFSVLATAGFWFYLLGMK